MFQLEHSCECSRRNARLCPRTLSVNDAPPPPPAITRRKHSPGGETSALTPGPNSDEVPAHARHLSRGPCSAIAHWRARAQRRARHLRLLRRHHRRTAARLAISLQPNLLRLAVSLPRSTSNRILLQRTRRDQPPRNHSASCSRPASASQLCPALVPTRERIHLLQHRAAILTIVRSIRNRGRALPSRTVSSRATRSASRSRAGSIAFRHAAGIRRSRRGVAHTLPALSQAS